MLSKSTVGEIERAIKSLCDDISVSRDTESNKKRAETIAILVNALNESDEKEEKKMKIRHFLAGVLAAVGMLLLIGSVGNGDYYGYLTSGDFAKIGVGVVLIGVAIPIGNAKLDGGGKNV